MIKGNIIEMGKFRQIGKEIFKIVICFLILVGFTILLMHEVSPRHMLFLLIDAILFNYGVHLFEKRNAYCLGIAMLMGIICSVFLIRYLTPTVIKVWEVDTYLSFAFAISNILLLSIAWRKFLVAKRMVASILLLFIFVPALVCWGYYFSEHAWFNTNAFMAILQTNYNEALTYVLDRTSPIMYVILAACLIVCGFIIKSVKYIRFKSGSWKYKIAVVIFAILNIVLVFRTRDNFVMSIYMETKNYQANYDEFERKKEARKQSLVQKDLAFSNKKGIYVMVIGESENRTRMSAYGYHFNTTPWLKSMKANPRMLLFQNAYPCHVQTVLVLTYALTTKNQYNNVSLENAASILDMAKAAGYETIWLSNQVKYGSWGTPVTVIASDADQQIWINNHAGNTLDTNYFDGELLKCLDNVKMSDKTLIVIHLMGSHISYHSRYPKEFEKFYEEGKNSEYDNSILYTDYVLQHLVNHFNKIPNFKGLVYFSDHGEAVNYGMAHNPSTFMFDMAYIPFFMYFSDSYIKENPLKYKILKSRVNDVFTNDLIFNAMMGIMGIKDKNFYEPQNDLTSKQYDNNINRFTTLYGKKKDIRR